MPPMDTGIAIVEFDTNSSFLPHRVEAVLSQVEDLLQQTPEVESISAVVGSEIDAISFGGGGGTAQAGKITVHLSPRTERSRSIWQIEEDWRQQLPWIEGLRTFRVSEYGATPVATTKAPFNIVISGPDTRVLDRLADKVLQRLRGTLGLLDLRRTWYQDKVEQQVAVDPELARLHATSPAAVATVLRTAVQGRVASTMALENYLDIPIRVRYQSDQVQDISQLQQVSVPTAYGPVLLSNLARIEENRDQPFLTRENLTSTIDITAGNQVLTIAEVTQQAQQRLKDLPLPAGYTLEIAGTLRDMNESGQELGQALLIGLVLLFILLLALFRSFIHPFTIMLSIPLAAAGGMWGLLAFNKPFCMPALMGIILLGGTIVNNAILMLDFILEARRSGTAKDEAILQSVQLRLRPILMTAVSTVVGFSPLIFEMAVGLERMSPLGIAARIRSVVRHGRHSGYYPGYLFNAGFLDRGGRYSIESKEKNPCQHGTAGAIHFVFREPGSRHATAGTTFIRKSRGDCAATQPEPCSGPGADCFAGGGDTCCRRGGKAATKPGERNQQFARKSCSCARFSLRRPDLRPATFSGDTLRSGCIDRLRSDPGGPGSCYFK